MTSESKTISEIPSLIVDHKVRNVLPENKRLILFLDYDGTLSPIVNKPEDAVLLPGMKTVIEKCASKFTIAVVSGRDTDDVSSRVGINGLIYAGSHGFSIKGPGDLKMEHESSDEILPRLSKLEDELHKMFIHGPKGLQIERKKYAITVHYRNVNPESIDEIMKTSELAVSGLSGIKKEKGKMIIEFKPDIELNKGMALKWILEKLEMWKDPRVFPVYLGDDVTDEDGFKILQSTGLGIIVGSHGYPTAARYRLRDVDEVREFLEWLAKNEEILKSKLS